VTNPKELVKAITLKNKGIIEQPQTASTKQIKAQTHVEFEQVLEELGEQVADYHDGNSEEINRDSNPTANREYKSEKVSTSSYDPPIPFSQRIKKNKLNS